jgi:1-aminocyclopropane-1-carboxylate deaminase/D-cysteine desulfhydrase-like pyridoxal-dependent ACC family enzyme
MYSISCLAKIKKIPFEYYCKKPPQNLYNNPIGNYKKSLENGMIIKTLSSISNLISEHENCENILFIHEGAFTDKAKLGIKLLADEINRWSEEQNFDINLLLPSGTGLMAFYLSKHLFCDVFTVPIVGDKKYLIKQFNLYEKNSKIPIVLDSDKKYYFGKLYSEFYQNYLDLLNTTKIEFDLLYDQKAILVMLENYEYLTNGKRLVYLHQGGVLGNISMLKRYEFNKF